MLQTQHKPTFLSFCSRCLRRCSTLCCFTISVRLPIYSSVCDNRNASRLSFFWSISFLFNKHSFVSNTLKLLSLESYLFANLSTLNFCFKTHLWNDYCYGHVDINMISAVWYQINEVSGLGACIGQWLLQRCGHVHCISYWNAPGMSSKTCNSTYLIAPDNSCLYPLNRRLCDPRTVWMFSRKEISFPLSRIRPQFISHPAQAVTTQTVLYWLRPTQYSCLVRNCAQQLCLQSAAKNTWSLHTFQPDICNQPDHILCTCVVGMLWVVSQCFTSH
jgi:hypothetical protein